MTQLTNTAIAAMLPGDELKDHVVPGLGVRCHRSGKSFMLYYRTKAGRARRPKLADCATMSLSDARDLARQWLADVAKGGDPAGSFSQARAEPTMDELWHRCEREHYTGETAWGLEAKRLYHKHAKPRIGKTHVRSLTYSDVNAVHQALRAEPFLANRVIAVLSKMLSLAERWSFRESGSNPCQHVERFHERKRKRYATADEMARLGPILARYAQDPVHLTGAAFLLLLLYSGARPSEIANAIPSQLERHVKDEDGQRVVFGVLRLDDSKTGQRDVFLPPQAMAVMDKLPVRRANLSGRPKMPRRLWRAIKKELGCGDLWARDMRRTFATIGLSNGMSASMMGELLGHASVQTTKIYAKLMEDPAHAAAAATASAVEKMLTAGK